MTIDSYKACAQRSARAPFSRPRSSSRLLACPSPRSRRDRGEDFFLIPRSFRGKNEEFLGFLTFFETDTKDETRIKLSPRSRRDRGEEFLLIPRSFRGRCEDLADLWFGRLKKLSLNFTLMSLTGNLKQMTDSDWSRVFREIKDTRALPMGVSV